MIEVAYVAPLRPLVAIAGHLAFNPNTVSCRVVSNARAHQPQTRCL